ncbi:MAG: DUF4389 domain-containing protein [Tepidiformaceae bacterium]
MSSGAYPVSLEVDEPQPQNRLSVLIRIIFAIPAMLFGIVIGIGLQIVALIAWVVILVTGKYPAGMMNFTEGGLRFSSRLSGYLYLLTDKSPSFSLDADPAYPVRLSVQGQIEGRNRLTVFFRLLMAIPHYLILGVLNYVIGVVVFVAWLMALFTGSVAPGLHTFIAGYLRWTMRAQGYVLLVTDEYPPFSLS